jgi:hypothetical protein
LTLFASGLALGILLFGALAPVAFASSGPTAAAPQGATTASGPLPVLLDGGQLSLGALKVSLVRDTVQPLASTLGTRSYQITVQVSVALPLLSLNLRTSPTSIWSWPSQMPEGPVALPPLADWTWTVQRGAVSDTSNWNPVSGGQALQRLIPVANATFTVTGKGALTVPVTVDPNQLKPYAPPSVGFVVNSAANYGAPMFPANNPTYNQLAAQLRPAAVRIDLSDLNASGWWDSATRLPVFNFTQFDKAFAWASVVHAPVLLTVSVGTWGDGNLLPTGMPVDKTLLVTKGSTSGYFPTGAAYQSYIRVIVTHILAANETVAYWGIGNELPLTNATVVSAYIGLFNVASKLIHTLTPTALVGTDVMMNKTYLPTFAKFSNYVGFLSFHFYPSIGVCNANGAYCPPKGPGNGTIDPRLWMPFAGLNGQSFYAPNQAQSAWKNDTGHSVPVLDTESNLNGFGGGPLSAGLGTDPRQQNLFGAAWTLSTLIDGARDNLTEMTYFTLNGGTQVPNTVTGPYGGWGYGMTAQGANGRDVEYAPYWALHIWSNAVPHSGTAVQVVASVPGILNLYAVKFDNRVTLVAVNQVDVPVTLQVQVNGSGWTGAWAHTLDGFSYVEKFNTSTQSEHLLKSSVRTTKLGHLGGPWNISIQGYGVTALRLLGAGAKGPFALPPSDDDDDTPGTTPASGSPAFASAPHVFASVSLLPGPAASARWVD